MMASGSVTGSPVERVVSQLKGVKPMSGGFAALCPSHKDRTASLSVKAGADGRVLLHCHAGCPPATILEAIGLSMSDLFTKPDLTLSNGNGADPKAVHDRGKMVAKYDYTDADGKLLFQVCRYEPKGFAQRRPENGKWAYGLGELPRVLYHLPAVIEAVAMKKDVFLVEGEKDADTLSEMGYVATTNPMGAGKWRPEYTETLAGGSVIILPDNDEPGRLHAEIVAAELAQKGSTVKVVNLPNLPPKGDVTDYVKSSEDSMDRFWTIISNTPRWAPSGAPRQNVWKLSELWDNDAVMRPPPPVVPRLAWAGRSTLLAAREKSGKSTLIGYIAALVTRGAVFLDEPCEKGDVLLVGLEEFLGDAARRLRHFKADPERISIMDSFRGDPTTRPLEIREQIDRLTPVLAIVDSLVAYAHGRGIDENDAAMASIVQPLTDIAHESGTAVIVVHHANKSSGKSRGSTAITGATDIVCEFFQPEEDTDPTRRRMRSVGRVPLIRQYDLKFDGDTYHLADGVASPVEQQIIGIVRDRPGLSINDLCEAIPGRRETTRTTAQTMLAQRTLENRGDSTTRAKLYVPAFAQAGFLR